MLTAEVLRSCRYATLHGSRSIDAHAATVSSPNFSPRIDPTNTTLAESPSSCVAPLVKSSPRIWSMLTTVMPAAIASPTTS
jgi:hypothetical protein